MEKKTAPLLLKLNSQNRHQLEGQLQCGIGDSFNDGEYLIQCPGCKTFYHIDCWSAYGSKCPRNSYSCWPDKIIVRYQCTRCGGSHIVKNGKNGKISRIILKPF